jgi:hypothetical protein
MKLFKFLLVATMQTMIIKKIKKLNDVKLQL